MKNKVKELEQKVEEIMSILDKNSRVFYILTKIIGEMKIEMEKMQNK